ncbi:MAG: HEAT repeat domain-containing protein [Theionarchaea archaeon]|nr:HEAT repeat domain-containing protein [Theionarchaea archaeon]
MDIPIELQEVLKRGECVLFVGAGASEGLPQWKSLMKPLAKDLEIDPNVSPLLIAEYYENEFGRPQLEDKIYDQLKKDVSLTDVHKIIPQLPFKAIITTNFDHQLEKALKGTEYNKIVDGRKAPDIKENQLALIKMHGDMKENGTMILTRTDYEDYPETHRAMITFLMRYFISNNFLFIGYNLNDPDLANIFAHIRSLFGENQRKSYMIIKKPPKEKIKQFELEMKGYEKKNIECIPIDSYDQILQIFLELVKICGQSVTITHEITSAQFESIKNTFLKVVERQNRWLDPRGIFQFDRILTSRDVELEEIYVVPRLLQRKLKRKKVVSDEEKRIYPLNIYLDELDEKQGGSLLDNKVIHDTKESSIEPVWDPLIGEKSPESASESEQIEVTITDLLSNSQQNQHVILGSPGVGKSCLLKYIAFKVSQDHASLGLNTPLFPVLIPLRECNRFGKDEMLKDFLFRYIRRKICSLPPEILSTLLEKNAFLLLFDGLDEIINESERVDLSRKIEQFIGQYENTKMIITSRPAGYRLASLIGSIPHYTLAEFNEEEIRELLRKWFFFLDKIEEERFDLAIAEEKAKNLGDIIIKERKGRILKLARNPLLLTILILTHRVGKTIPERRVEFYDYAVKTISGSWEKWKNLEINKNKDIPDQDIILHILEKIGFYLHLYKQENIVDITELKQWIQEAMEEEIGTCSRKQITDFIWMLQERAGLLVERGIDLYGFVHLTFQEYFAARYIATGRGISEVDNLIHEYLYSSRWREVFFLAISTANPQEADIILDATLKAHNPFEEYIHSNLMMAGLMLTDVPRVSSSERGKLISKLISLTSPKTLNILRIDAIEILTKIGKLFSIENEWALELLNEPDADVRDQAVRYFTVVGSDDEAVQKKFFELLNEPDADVRDQAARYFTVVGSDDEAVQKKFFELLNDPDADVRDQAVRYFTVVGSDDEAVQKKFFELLNDPDADVRDQAVRYFTAVGSDDEAVQKKFFELLNDPKGYVRDQAARYFTVVGSDDEAVQKKFFELLNDPKGYVRDQAVRYFTVVGSDDEAVQKKFFELLNDPKGYVRDQAARYFATVASDDEKVQKKFFELLNDPDEDVRYRALQYFATVASDDEKVRKRIFELLGDTTFSFIFNKSIQDLAVEYLSKYAKQQSFQKAPILFQNESMKRGAYKLMKKLLGVEY